MKLNNITFNLANAPIRRETLQGRGYIVAPMAMLTEGVHNGSNGPLLYRAADIERAVPAWNMKPIVVYHPQINNKGITACDPDVLEKQQVGMVMNTTYNGKLRAEAWIEEDLATKVDDRVVTALEDNAMMEVSTGLFTDNVKEDGKFDGKDYTGIATNHQPDHLALLPDQIGACSIADGAGLLQLNEAAKTAHVETNHLFARGMDYMRRMVGNAMSHSNIYSALSRALKERFKPTKDQYLWVADVYDDFVVYEIEGDGKTILYRLNYTEGETGVTLSTDTPVVVVRVTEYRTPTGDFVGNDADTNKTKKPTKNKKMDKTTLVDDLIANTASQWGENDRETLMNFDEDALSKMSPVEVEEAPATPQEPTDNTEEATDTPVEPMTTEAYIDGAPPEVQEVLRNGLAAHNTEKELLIKQITDNEGNKFSPEFLDGKGLDELRGMAALATPTANHHQPGVVPMFTGQATPPAPTANADAIEETPLEAPTMNFGKETNAA